MSTDKAPVRVDRNAAAGAESVFPEPIPAGPKHKLPAARVTQAMLDRSQAVFDDPDSASYAVTVPQLMEEVEKKRKQLYDA